MTRKLTAATIAAAGILAVGAGTALSSSSPSGSAGGQQPATTGHGQGGPHSAQGKGHQGQGPGNRSHLHGAAGGATSPLTLSAEAKDDLLFMREEEKLAQDVYAALAQRYPDAPFARITLSESRHASAVQRQLDRAGIADPTVGNAAGEFENTELQRLYDDLVARGAASRAEALKVGVLIEQTDIADLKQAAATVTDAQLKRVYSNLERASEQHLAAFTRAQSS